MRILMISPQFRPTMGGYERAAERLSAALADRGHAVTVITERRDPAWPAVEATNGVKLRRLWCLYRLGLHIITSLLSLAAFLSLHGRRFDVWHVHQYGVQAATAVALGKLLGRPVVLKLTSSENQGLSLVLAQGRLPRLMAYLHRRVDAVVALTRETAAEARAFGIPSSRIHILGNGVDTDTFRPREAEERLALQKRLGVGYGPVVMFVGRLSDEKNVAGLLAAWEQARPKMPEGWRLLLVGDGPLRNELILASKKRQIDDTAEFVGQQANVAEWLAIADIYVLASHNEGLSNTLLEAMATGLPVVVTSVSGSIELVQENGCGLVVPTNDPASLSSALLDLAASADKRHDMGARARHLIEQRYAVGYVANAHEALYATLAGCHGPRKRTKEEVR